MITPFLSPAVAIRLRARRRKPVCAISICAELRLDGELKARYQGRYLEITEYGVRAVASQPAIRKPVRKDHNAGGRSPWMQGFFDRPSPPLWKAIGE